MGQKGCLYFLYFTSLDGAARWSGTKLKEGGQMTVDAAKKAGQGTKVAGKDVGKMFKSIGDGIEDVGRNL